MTSRTGVIWGYELVCEWLIQDVWRTSSQSLEILIRLKRLSWTVRPIGWLPLHVAFYERPLKIRDVIFIEIETRIISNNHNGFIFGIWTPLVYRNAFLYHFFILAFNKDLWYKWSSTFNCGSFVWMQILFPVHCQLNIYV